MLHSNVWPRGYKELPRASVALSYNVVVRTDQKSRVHECMYMESHCRLIYS
jgi:hypothetical protein